MKKIPDSNTTQDKQYRCAICTELSSNKGRLTKKSIKVITENVQERLATLTKWRKGKYKIVTTFLID